MVWSEEAGLAAPRLGEHVAALVVAGAQTLANTHNKSAVVPGERPSPSVHYLCLLNPTLFSVVRLRFPSHF